MVIDNHELEQKLSLLCDSPKYQELFRYFFDGNMSNGSFSISLAPSFLMIYNYRLLIPIEEESRLKYAINKIKKLVITKLYIYHNKTAFSN